MSQFGMQMPGGRAARRAGPDVYTVLLVIATLMLGTACAVVGLSATKVAPDGNILQLQDENRISLPDW